MTQPDINRINASSEESHSTISSKCSGTNILRHDIHRVENMMDQCDMLVWQLQAVSEGWWLDAEMPCLWY